MRRDSERYSGRDADSDTEGKRESEEKKVERLFEVRGEGFDELVLVHVLHTDPAGHLLLRCTLCALLFNSRTARSYWYSRYTFILSIVAILFLNLGEFISLRIFTAHFQRRNFEHKLDL